MLFNKVLSSFIREVYEVRKSRLYLSVVLILPLAMLAFFAMVFYKGTIEELPITVVDHDNTPMSRQLCLMIDATRGVEIAYQVQSIAEAERQMLSSQSLGIVYIKRDFEADIYGGVPTKVECYLPGTNISASGVIGRDVEQTVMTFASGVALNRLQAMGIGYNEAMVDIMPINIQSNIVGNPYLNYGYYLAPIFMFMGIVIFIVVATIYAFGRELRYATASEWISSANGSLLSAVLGKALPITIVMAIISQLAFAILFVIMGMECNGSYLMLTICNILLILAYQSFAIFIVSLTANLRLGLSLGGGYAVMAFTFSGITFPVIAMYDIAQWLSKLFPLGYFSDILIDQAVVGAPILYNANNLLCLSLFLLLVPLVWRRLRRIMTNEIYWSRD